MTIINVTAPLSEAEQNALQGAAFVKESGVPFAEDKTVRNWHFGGRGPNKNSAAGRDAQADAHGKSVLESSR